jgi:hypothetical protein
MLNWICVLVHTLRRLERCNGIVVAALRSPAGTTSRDVGQRARQCGAKECVQR